MIFGLGSLIKEYILLALSTKKKTIQMHDHLPSKMMWKSKCMIKHKFFAWLILHDRINTKDMIIQRHWRVTDNNDCVLCHQHVLEDWKHLFFACQFSSRIWNYLQIQWRDYSIEESLAFTKETFKGPCFTEVAILA
jgi:hypothetical protein